MLANANTMIWRTQDILHKKPQLVPGALLLLASSLVVYRHFTHDKESDEGDLLKTFLAMILVQMLPLVALEMKIMSCADPVGLFCKFATPVTLTHAIFLGMRLGMPLVLSSGYEDGVIAYSGTAFVGALVTICWGFRQRLSGILQCYTVWKLVALAMCASMCTTALDGYINADPEDDATTWATFFKHALETSNSYIEIVAFVPAVWDVYREDKSASKSEVEYTDTVRTSTAFFLFLVGFYVTEDLLNAYQVYQISALVSIAHIAHFLLLLDFAVYVQAHVFNPEKLVGDLRKWLTVDYSHEV